MFNFNKIAGFDIVDIVFCHHHQSNFSKKERERRKEKSKKKNRKRKLGKLFCIFDKDLDGICSNKH